MSLGAKGMKQTVFVPQDDITVKELADIVSGLMIIVPQEVINKLDPGIQRHFKEIPDRARDISVPVKPRIVVPK